MIAEILSNKKVSDPYYKMELKCPELVDEIKPGQFLMFKVREGYEPYLRRPFSFYEIKFSKAQTSFEILYKVVGLGTRLISEMKGGEKVDIIAPLGNGFSISLDIRTVVIVAGGIGLAPLLFLTEEINQKRKEKGEIIFLYGGQGRADIIDINRIKNCSSEVRICTEDGSIGSKMLVTELLEGYLREKGTGKYDRRSIGIFSCGPKAMLRIVSSIAKKYDIPCQVSLESFMACGFGACLGCVVKVFQERSTEVAYERVCKEGPVFDSGRIVWDE
jgi:dihydroorotate dehydrogenase electron transfer subunit